MTYNQSTYIRVRFGVYHFVRRVPADVQQYYCNAFYEPKLSNSENVESWEEAGAEDMRLRAFKRWHTLLEQYEAPPLDVALKEALDAFVTQRKGSMPDGWD